MSNYDVRFFWGDYTSRQRQANGLKAICYVEQHFNGTDNPKSGGTEVIVSYNASKTSRDWGSSYAKRVSKALETTLRHKAQGGLLVGGYNGRGNGNLKYTSMPAILLEPCFATNPLEAAKIRDPFTQRIMAAALVSSIKEFFPKGGLVAFSVGHKGKTSSPLDRGVGVVGGGVEADYAEAVLNMAAKMLTGYDKIIDTPLEENEPDTRDIMGARILYFEARRDAHGRLAVYDLPEGDGGGSYEVAGINNKYHPQPARKLRRMIENKEFQAAEDFAAQYIVGYTDAVVRWFDFDGVDASPDYQGIEFFLRDSSFNRGPTGAARILQRALGVKTDGRIGTKTKAAFKTQLTDDWKELLDQLRSSREWYERQYAHRDENNKFWNGLVNRWNNAREAALDIA